MINEYSPEFTSPQLTSIQDGEIALGTPLIDNVIQIGRIGVKHKDLLIISKECDSVTVERSDGDAIQVEVTVPARGRPGAEVTMETFQVFEEPVQGLKFVRTQADNGIKYWVAVAESRLRVVNVNGISRFAVAIGSYASKKQFKSNTIN